ncbi:MAG: hypothetical protein LBJ61_01305 [Deltaproteobacteria bacterium]|jgi:hypothetical protein|nr:hypothetical protein [Deltaproteobacteria bacterium]
MPNNPNLSFVKIPDYDYSVLPEGIHPITESEFQAFFVTSFPDSSTRHEIAEKYGIFRQKLQQFFSSIHWIDGSFVESKTNPNDVDVAVIIPFDDILNLTFNFEIILNRYFENKNEMKKEYLTHPFSIIKFPDEHIFNYKYHNSITYWKKWFGHNRNNQSKGFVALEVNKK